MEKHRMIQYALNKNDELVYIDDVPNGNNCECHCTFCKEPLNARNGGSINIHHFAHLSGTDCKNAFERTVHLLAKQIIVEEQRIPLFDNNDQPIKIENIEIEKDLGDIRAIANEVSQDMSRNLEEADKARKARDNEAR